MYFQNTYMYIVMLQYPIKNSYILYGHFHNQWYTKGDKVVKI